MTAMESASATVESLCATTTVVRPTISAAMLAVTAASLSASSALVACTHTRSCQASRLFGTELADGTMRSHESCGKALGPVNCLRIVAALNAAYLIEQQDLRIAQDRPRQRNPLLLSSRQLHASLSHLPHIAHVRKCYDCCTNSTEHAAMLNNHSRKCGIHPADPR